MEPRKAKPQIPASVSEARRISNVTIFSYRDEGHRSKLVELPKEAMNNLGLSVGDLLFARVDASCLVLSPAPRCAEIRTLIRSNGASHIAITTELARNLKLKRDTELACFSKGGKILLIPTPTGKQEAKAQKPEDVIRVSTYSNSQLALYLDKPIFDSVVKGKNKRVELRMDGKGFTISGTKNSELLSISNSLNPNIAIPKPIMETFGWRVGDSIPAFVRNGEIILGVGGFWLLNLGLPQGF